MADLVANNQENIWGVWRSCGCVDWGKFYLRCQRLQASLNHLENKIYLLS